MRRIRPLRTPHFPPVYGRKVSWQDSCEVLLGGVTPYVSVLGFYRTPEYPHAAPEKTYAAAETAVLETEAAETAALETGEAAETAPEAAAVKRTVALESGEAAAVERTVALETGEESMALAASLEAR